MKKYYKLLEEKGGPTSLEIVQAFQGFPYETIVKYLKKMTDEEKLQRKVYGKPCQYFYKINKNSHSFRRIYKTQQQNLF